LTIGKKTFIIELANRLARLKLMGHAMAVTLKDVSKITGVNTGTISQVLNRHPKGDAVRDDTKKRIFAAAKQIGYQRNELAATTRTGVNRTVAMIGDFEEVSTFMNSVISGVLTSATEHDYGVRVYSPLQLNQCLNEILSYRMKSVIVVSLNEGCRQRVADFCKKHDLKLVYVFEESCEFFPAVASADRAGMRHAVLKLAELGHKRIALICAKHAFHYMDERHAGYLEGVEAAGLPVIETLIDCHRYSKDSVLAAEKMLDLPETKRPTAFLCIADSIAIQIMNKVFLKGLKVPQDISIIGFGNDTLCESSIVPLTSISQSFKAMGTSALKLVLEKDCDIEANSKNEYLLDTKLINRESVAICKSNK
jgi:LacI family transcriptional regulator, galactose operon repressor